MTLSTPSPAGRKALAAAALLAVLALAPALIYGFRPIAVKSIDGAPEVAIGGYDTVAYFTEGRAVRGSGLLAASWQGAEWFFISQEHRSLFVSDPERYAPKYGGYCAFCVGQMKEAVTSGDPEIFMIVDGDLFLLQSEEVRRQWKQDPQRFAAESRAVYDDLLAQFEATQAGATARAADGP